MGHAPTGQRKYTIQHLWEHTEEVCRLLVQGIRPNEISAQLGITVQMISVIRNSPVAQARIRELALGRDEEAQKVAESIQKLVPLAIKALEEVAGNPAAKESARVAASRDILDRAGYAVQRQANIIHSHAHMHLTNEDLDVLKQRAREEAIKQGKLVELNPAIDIDYEIVDDSEEEGYAGEC